MRKDDARTHVVHAHGGVISQRPKERSAANVYPLSQFDGEMKLKDWTKLPHYPAPKSVGKGEIKYVNPETFFDELPVISVFLSATEVNLGSNTRIATNDG